MEKGSDINSVFNRLVKACSKIEKQGKYAHSPQLGYITSRPSTLGTALRMTILVELPNLKHSRREFQALSEHYTLSMKAVPKSDNQPYDNLYEISNRKRFGLSEVQLIQNIYDGVKQMIGLEWSISNPQDIVCGRHLQFWEELTSYPTFSKEVTSLLSIYLTREIWITFRDMCDSTGYSFRQLIFSGCTNTDSDIGVHAGSEDSYYTFIEFLRIIIMRYHSVKLETEH